MPLSKKTFAGIAVAITAAAYGIYRIRGSSDETGTEEV